MPRADTMTRRPRWSIRRARLLVGTKFLLLAGLIGFVLISWLFELVVGLGTAVDLGPVFAGFVAAVPAVLWLGFFYLMSRRSRGSNSNSISGANGSISPILSL